MCWLHYTILTILTSPNCWLGRLIGRQEFALLKIKILLKKSAHGKIVHKIWIEHLLGVAFWTCACREYHLEQKGLEEK